MLCLVQFWNNLFNLADKCLLHVLAYQCKSATNHVKEGSLKRVKLEMVTRVWEYPLSTFAAVGAFDRECERWAGNITGISIKFGVWVCGIGCTLQASGL